MSLLDEPVGVYELMRHWVPSFDVRRGDWTDVYLAAFATAIGARLVSFGAGFGRYPGLHWLHLKP